MKDNVILSIILPIYNVENYIEKSIQSLLAGKKNECLEIILVDDGSLDASGIVADEYARKYKNINVYHKTNGGLSDARNYGLMKASGKYVFFMDSDDIIESKHLSQIIEKLMNTTCDVVLWDACLIDESGDVLNCMSAQYYVHAGLVENKKYEGVNAIYLQLLNHKDFVTTVWLGAYKREFLLKYGFWFEYGVLHEDELWTPKVLISAKDLEYVSVKFYKYRVRENSIMTERKDRSKNLQDLIFIFSSMYIYYDWMLDDLAIKKEIKGNLSRRYLHKISQFNAYKYPDLKKIIDRKTIYLNARGIKDKLRSGILLINMKIFCVIDNYFRKNKD